MVPVFSPRAWAMVVELAGPWLPSRRRIRRRRGLASAFMAAVDIGMGLSGMSGAYRLEAVMPNKLCRELLAEFSLHG
ncbi:hypothetical protein GCM10023223_02290 [Stackebrandtia albiflava]